MPGWLLAVLLAGGGVGLFALCGCGGLLLYLGMRTSKGSAQPRLAPGLHAEFFAGDNFDRKVTSRIDPQINFDWVWDSPAPGVPADHFSVKWTGFLKAPVPGRYTLITETDDGVRLYLDGKLLIDHWRPDDAAGEKSVEVELTAQPHALEFDFVEGIGFASARFFWRGPGMVEERQLVPPSALFHDPAAVNKK